MSGEQIAEAPETDYIDQDQECRFEVPSSECETTRVADSRSPLQDLAPEAWAKWHACVEYMSQLKLRETASGHQQLVHGLGIEGDEHPIHKLIPMCDVAPQKNAHCHLSF